jgi:hypothetical protein
VTPTHRRLDAAAIAAAACLCALLAASPARAAAPAPDPDAILTLQVENDAVSGTDKYYTAGQQLGYTSPTGAVPGFVASLGHLVWGDGQQRLNIQLQQSIFTPSDTQVSDPDPRDRPYAAVLVGNFNLIQDTAASRSTIGVSLGVAGPAALGREIQNGFHSLIGDTSNKGWGYQIDNEPIVQASVDRIWRLPVASFLGLETDALPQVGATVGTWRDYAMIGGAVRLGQGLASDFGAPRMTPGLSGGEAYNAVRPFAWYLYAGGDGQAVAYDTTLNGSFTGASRHVNPEAGVGEFQAGLAILAFGLRLSAFHVIQTKEFTHQQGGTFSFDGVALSAKF